MRWDDYKKVCDLFNEILDELKSEYEGLNIEYGILGITEEQRQYLHQYRVKLNELLGSIN